MLSAVCPSNLPFISFPGKRNNLEPGDRISYSKILYKTGGPVHGKGWTAVHMLMHCPELPPWQSSHSHSCQEYRLLMAAPQPQELPLAKRSYNVQGHVSYLGAAHIQWLVHMGY